MTSSDEQRRENEQGLPSESQTPSMPQMHGRLSLEKN